MTPQVVTAPTRYPVTISDAREQLRIDDTTSDVVIAAYIAAAVSHVEQLTGRALITRTLKGFLDDFPEETWLDLPRGPLQSVTHVKSYDDSDVATTFSTSSYYVDTTSFYPRIVLRTSASWPTVDRVANGVEVQWVAGYGDSASDVPEPIRLAILLLVAHWHENREASGEPMTDIPHGVHDMLVNYRAWSL